MDDGRFKSVGKLFMSYLFLRKLVKFVKLFYFNYNYEVINFVGLIIDFRNLF